MRIGIFDSGLGGLYIFRQLLKKFPQYDYVYLGDNARVPYGGRSPELIYQFTREAVEFLFEKDCQLIILACNTASAIALRRLQQEYLPNTYQDRRILGVIIPTVEKVIDRGVKNVGVIGTRATVNSDSYLIELKKLNPGVNVFQQECPLLVPLIEEGEVAWEGLDLLIKKYLKKLPVEKLNSLILACTHYGLIAEQIEKNLPTSVKVISQNEVVAEKLKEYFLRHPEIEKKLTKNAQRTYYVTDLSQKYENLVKLFLGKEFEDEEKIMLVKI